MFNNLRIVVGIIILMGSLLKFIYPESITNIVLFFQIGNESSIKWIVYLLATTEFFVSSCLIFKKKLSKILPIIIFLSSCYLFISIFGFAYDFEELCGELSKFNFGRFDIPMILRNGTLFLISIFIFITHKINMKNNQ